MYMKDIKTLPSFLNMTESIFTLDTMICQIIIHQLSLLNQTIKNGLFSSLQGLKLSKFYLETVYFCLLIIGIKLVAVQV